MNINFKNEIVIITGASRGIGKNIAINFAKNNAKVILISRSKDKLKLLNKEINNKYGKASYYAVDISDYESYRKILQNIIKKYKKIDVLINNAGITRDNLILRMKEIDWDLVINTNLKGTFNSIKLVTKNMLSQKKGKIINITSIVGIIGNAGQANYSASKSGIIGLTKSVAKEFASRNITVNAIAPGYINTEMTESLSIDVKNKYINNIPLQRFGAPQDISNLALFLSSNYANYLTGQVITIDGGEWMYNAGQFTWLDKVPKKLWGLIEKTIRKKSK